MNYKQGDKLPAVVVVGSLTSVKEQMSGLYAQKLADQGIVALAFDYRFFGEWGGEFKCHPTEALLTMCELVFNRPYAVQESVAEDPNGLGQPSQTTSRTQCEETLNGRLHRVVVPRYN